MSRLAALVREPAMLIDAFETLVVMLVALGLFNLHGDQQTNIIAAFIALLAVAKAFLTQPFPVTVIPDFGRAALVLSASFGLIHVGADQITIVVTFLGTLMTLIQRAQVTPRYDPVIQAGGAGAGPVAGENGEVDILSILGIVLLLAGLFVLLVQHALILGIVLVLVGAVLIAVSVRGGTRV